MNNNIIIAITGPSGVGKTTLSNNLIEKSSFVTPRHTTTRNERLDDIPLFYRYLSHDEFKNKANNEEFLYWSGDNEIIDKKYGNYYGVLTSDYEVVSTNDKIIVFISYKDIDSIRNLISKGYNIKIVNLVYANLENSMAKRLNQGLRNHSKEEIEKRIACAKDYELRFGEKLSSPDILKISTDITSIDDTYDIVLKKLVRKR